MLFEPFTTSNQKLKANVFPEDWKNPTPRGTYNLVVIGGGPAGLIIAAGAAGLGAKVALIEKHALGGDCLNVGCIPSKALIRAARAAHEAQTAGERFGVHAREVTVDFPAVMERMRALRAGISPVDSAQRYQEELGVDVFLGEGHFLDTHRIAVGEDILQFKKAAITTGARAARLPIPGLWESGALSNETVFSLTELPKRLAVIGAGPIGCELAQAFRRLGSEVTLLESVKPILNREDPEAAAIVEQALRKEGVAIKYEFEISQVTAKEEEKTLHLAKDGSTEELIVDQILVGVGRAPNVEGLNLEKAGVVYDRQGITISVTLQTSASHIYAAGDVAMKLKFTHTADAAARIVIQNALFLGQKKLSSLVVPWCTYTDPEIAHVGLYRHEAEDQGLEVETFTQELAHLDRALLDDESEGFVKVHSKKGSGEILGATIVAAHAGELISEIGLAITHGLTLSQIASTIHPYPTQAEAIKRVGDAYNRTKLTPTVAGLMKKWLAWTRS
jgi:pyruvate/2-oxoglutarate dehydrogenase complex dihydrolipoamide dehydrogenase (E3) component